MTLEERHNQGLFQDKTLIEVNQYGEKGLNLLYYYRELLNSPTATSEDMERARREACEAVIKLGGNVILSVFDSMQIPENDRNAPISIETMEKKVTGDPGDEYYDWQPLDNHKQRINKTRYLLDRKK